LIHIKPSTQPTLLITLHVSALMGHLQVFPFIHYQLIELQRELHTFSLTYLVHRLYTATLVVTSTLLGDINLCGTIASPDIKVKIAL
jgi:hypothetical protein